MAERRSRGWAQADERGEAIDRRHPPAAREALAQRALDAPTATQRIAWRRRAADLVQQASVGHSACQRGCSHCCHIPVQVSEAEAKIIGREIGRMPVKATSIVHAVPIPSVGLSEDDPAMRALEALQRALVERYTGVPCTFLNAQGECSIYASRPLACRRLINLDSDALLCRLVPRQGHGGCEELGPPRLDMRLDQAIDALCMRPGSPLADLRDWFPLLAINAGAASSDATNRTADDAKACA